MLLAHYRKGLAVNLITLGTFRIIFMSKNFYCRNIKVSSFITTFYIILQKLSCLIYNVNKALQIALTFIMIKRVQNINFICIYILITICFKVGLRARFCCVDVIVKQVQQRVAVKLYRGLLYAEHTIRARAGRTIHFCVNFCFGSNSIKSRVQTLTHYR